MKSKRFCNRTIIIEDLKRFFGVSILYFIAIFINGPMYIFSRGDISSKHELSRIIRVINDIELLGSITGIVGIILGILLFRYLHNKNSAAVIHGYPFKRSELLTSHIISGIILISIPIILNTIIFAVTLPKITSNINISSLVGNDVDLEKITRLYSSRQTIYWLLKMEIIGIMAFLISAFTAIASGVTIIQSALAFILPFTPLFIIILLREGLEIFVFGFATIFNRWDTFASTIIPIPTFNSYRPWQLGYIIWYILLCVLLYFLCLWLYQKRDLEKAQDTIAFDILKPIFKYGVTFCTMILAGGYFYALNGSMMWLWLGAFGGSFLGYFISEMLMEKSIKVFGKYKGYILYVAVIAVVIVGMKVDLFGYEKRVPELSQVKEVYFQYFEPHDKGITEKENIELVLGIHRNIIDNKKDIIKAKEQRNHSGKTYLRIGYLYTNGKKIIRAYRVPDSLLVNNDRIKKLYESEEYKRIRNKSLLELNLDEVNKVSIRNYDYDKSKIISDKREIEELFEVVKEEVLSESYESMIDKNRWSGIRFGIDDTEYSEFSRYLVDDPYAPSRRDVYIDFKRAYFNLEKWFAKKGYLKDIRILPEEIKYIVIQEVNKTYGDTYMIDDNEIKQDLKMTNSKRVEIKDKEKIEEILRTNNDSWSKNMKYIVAIYTENGKFSYGWYDEESALKYFSE